MTNKKLAIFVEGQTEVIFTEKLIIEILGHKNVSINSVKARQGLAEISASKFDEQSFYVLIFDCEGDDSVKSQILEKREALIKNQFDSIIGLRDVYPIESNNIQRLEMGLKTGVPTKNISISIFIAKMEVEAWFLQESNHYRKIHPSLTDKHILQKTNFCPSTHNAEDVYHPAELLNKIYNLAGFSYKKNKRQTTRTVQSLDYEELYINLPSSLPYLKKFIDYLDAFFI